MATVYPFFMPGFLRRTAMLALLTAAGSGLALSGCSSSKSKPSTTSGGDGGGGSCTGGPVSGAADTHCGTTVQATGTCQADTGPAGDAGAEEPAPPTRYGTEGDDDDCKYHIKIKFPNICESEEAMFEVTLTSKVDGKPVKGANPSIEQSLDGVLGPPATDSSTEKSGAEGVYEVPAIFNKPGKWEAKFHFFETCSDAPADSPHGHGTFYVEVP
jgi:hypothetical protein